MDPISSSLKGYADYGVLGLTILVLIGACIHLWRAREADRKAHDAFRDKADGIVKQLQDQRVEQAQVIADALNRSSNTNELLGNRMENIADLLRRERH